MRTKLSKTAAYLLALCVLMLQLPCFTLTVSAAAQKSFTLTSPADVMKTTQTSDDYYYLKMVWTVDDNVSSATSDNSIRNTYYMVQPMNSSSQYIATTPYYYTGWNSVSTTDVGLYFYYTPSYIENAGSQASATIRFAASEKVNGVYVKLVNSIGSTRSHGTSGKWYVSDSGGYLTSSKVFGTMKLGHKVDGYRIDALQTWGFDTVLAEHSILGAHAHIGMYGTSLPTTGKNTTIRFYATASTNYGTDVGAFATPGKVTKAEVLVNGAAAEGVSVSADGSSVVVNINDNIYNSIGDAAEAKVKARLYVTMPGKTEGVWTDYTDAVTLTRPTVATSTVLTLNKLSISGNSYPYIRTQANYILSVTDELYKLPDSIEIKVDSTVLSSSQYTYNSTTGEITIPAKYVTGGIRTTALAINPYTVTYNANGGTGSMTSVRVKSGSSYILKTNAFTRSGYVFKVWATSAGGSVMYQDKATITPDKDLTLYAVWECSNHTDADWNGKCDKCDEMIDTEIVLDKTSVTVNNYTGGVLILASYSGDGKEKRLTDCKIITEEIVSGKAISISDTGLNTSGSLNVKAFLLKDITSIKPLCEAKSAAAE